MKFCTDGKKNIYEFLFQVNTPLASLCHTFIVQSEIEEQKYEMFTNASSSNSMLLCCTFPVILEMKL